jgi:hypothetical protein
MKKFKAWFKYNLSFLSVLNSPLKGLKLVWYFGKISRGTPYFLPRKLVKMSLEDCQEALEKDLNRSETMGWNFGKTPTIEDYKNSKKFVPIKYFGINYTTLGWKTKYDSYRYEWCPMFSLVIFGKQLHITVVPNVKNDDYNIYIDCYWEAYLNWEYETDKKATKEERFKQLIDKYSCTWISRKDNVEIKNDHYFQILNNKYLELYKQIKNETKKI